MKHLPFCLAFGLLVAPFCPAAEPCQYLVTMADDFVVDVYLNGQPIPDAKRELTVECFGASGEKINVPVAPGDWLVFHVVQNRMRWNGSKYFAVAGCAGPDRFAFVSDPASLDWSACDDPARVAEFIRNREAGRDTRARVIEAPWGDGDGLIRGQAGASFNGKPLWGKAPSTWIKYNAPAAPLPPPPLLEPRRWPVQILSAIYGTDGKDADVTARVKGHVETERRQFSANPGDLGADPNPHWNKGLHIIYMKDGVRREQWRNENETVLPESFYGPQDATELRAWLLETRWTGKGGEIQFHADGTFTVPGQPDAHRWTAASPSSVKLDWSEKRSEECRFNYPLSSFSAANHPDETYFLVK